MIIYRTVCIDTLPSNAENHTNLHLGMKARYAQWVLWISDPVSASVDRHLFFAIADALPTIFRQHGAAAAPNDYFVSALGYAAAPAFTHHSASTVSGDSRKH